MVHLRFAGLACGDHGKIKEDEGDRHDDVCMYDNRGKEVRWRKGKKKKRTQRRFPK